MEEFGEVVWIGPLNSRYAADQISPVASSSAMMSGRPSGRRIGRKRSHKLAHEMFAINGRYGGINDTPKSSSLLSISRELARFIRLVHLLPPPLTDLSSRCKKAPAQPRRAHQSDLPNALIEVLLVAAAFFDVEHGAVPRYGRPSMRGPHKELLQRRIFRWDLVFSDEL